MKGDAGRLAAAGGAPSVSEAAATTQQMAGFRAPHGPNSPAALPLEEPLEPPPLGAGGCRRRGRVFHRSLRALGALRAPPRVWIRAGAWAAAVPAWARPAPVRIRPLRSPAALLVVLDAALDRRPRRGPARDRAAAPRPAATQAAAPPAVPAQTPAPSPAPRSRRRASRPQRPPGRRPSRSHRSLPAAASRGSARASWARSNRDRGDRQRAAPAPRPPAGPPGRRATPSGSGRRRAGARARAAASAALASPSQKAESSGPISAQRLPSSLRDEQRAEALPPLGQAAVDFGLAEAGDLADLGVGVALREQGQRPQLRRLQRLQRLAAAGDRLAPLDPLRRAVGLGRDQRDPVLAVAVPAPAAAGPPSMRSRSCADRQRLVLDDRLRPADQFPHVVGGRFVRRISSARW